MPRMARSPPSSSCPNTPHRRRALQPAERWPSWRCCPHDDRHIGSGAGSPAGRRSARRCRLGAAAGPRSMHRCLPNCLIGEIELSTGEAGNAYARAGSMQHGARRDESLFKAQCRCGAAGARGRPSAGGRAAWRQALPESWKRSVRTATAGGTQSQPGRSRAAQGAARGARPDVERSALIATLPRLFQRVVDKNAAAVMLEICCNLCGGALDPHRCPRGDRRSWWLAADAPRALQHAERAFATTRLHLTSPARARIAARLACGGAIVTATCNNPRLDVAVQLAYVRALRREPALCRCHPRNFRASLAASPSCCALADPRCTAARIATATRWRSVRCSAFWPCAPRRRTLPAPARTDDDEDDSSRRSATTAPDAGLADAGAGRRATRGRKSRQRLARQDRQPAARARGADPRAILLARQGKLREARLLVQQVPERRPADTRAKMLAESQVLREGQALERGPPVLVRRQRNASP